MSTQRLESLVQALLDGDETQALDELERLQQAKVTPRRIVSEGIEEAMSRLDAKCTLEQFNLLEIMLCGRAITALIKRLYPLDQPPPHSRGTILLASLEGDIHDLGKNIVKVVLTATGYFVIDGGKDCSLDRLIDSAKQHTPIAVGVSGLITTVIPQVLQVRDRLARDGLGSVPVLAGGAALRQASAEQLKVDFLAQTAFDGLGYLEQITGART
ncbi:cobalamin B12-binding domain-containing protein [Thiorhodococcus minor]|uniref:Cobalamin-binding protein n=1 Tax=Thiorhodococcus minor TaxID=57489 RepID=A0A6M0JSC4_9GAMM|nr:cobalamin-dependent protein [Thiorhodococcus minor]NEV60420.1 cobalamin-binding protein [Thiorhodococcus minor]